MNIVPSSTQSLNLHVLLEETQTGQIIASIAELANCQVEANSRAEALVAIQKLVSDRLNNIEVLPLEVSLEAPGKENPWTEFIGIFKGNAEFEQMAAQWQAERENKADDLR